MRAPGPSRRRSKIVMSISARVNRPIYTHTQFFLVRFAARAVCVMRVLDLMCMFNTPCGYLINNRLNGIVRRHRAGFAYGKVSAHAAQQRTHITRSICIAHGNTKQKKSHCMRASRCRDKQ